MRRSVLAPACTVIVAAVAVAIASPSAAPSVARAPRPVASFEYEPAASLTPVAPSERSGSNDPSEQPGRDFVPSNAAPRTQPAPAGSSARAPRTSGSEIEFLSDALFRQLDTDRDGVLTGAEIPTAFRGAAGPSEAISAETFAILFQATVQKLRANPVAAPPSTRTASAQPGREPAWFMALDPKSTGQVSLHSWRVAGGTVSEFERMDTDGDGRLTRPEVQTFLAQRNATARADGAASGSSSLRGSSGTSGPNAARSSSAPDTATADGAPASRADALLAHFAGIAAGRNVPKSKGGKGPNAAASAKPAAPASSSSPASRPSPGSAAPAPAAPSSPPSPPPPLPLAALPLPLTDDDYWVFRNNENLAFLSSGVQPDVLFLGDSITDLLRVGDGAPLWNAFYDPLNSFDFAISGITTSHVLWQIETGQVAQAAPKVVVVLIGSNNLGYGQAPGDVAVGIQKIVEELGVQLPDTRVLLLGLLPRGWSATDNPFRQQIPAVNGPIANLADGDRVTYLDMGGWFLEPDDSISPDVLFDGAHPTLWGYYLYSNVVLPALNDLLNNP